MPLIFCIAKLKWYAKKENCIIENMTGAELINPWRYITGITNQIISIKDNCALRKCSNNVLKTV